MTPREQEIIQLIRKEVKPALGCTEPIAVALAVAKAMETAQDNCSDLKESWRYAADYMLSIQVSGNILKNGMGVGIPGTGMVGLHIAAALGAVCGKSSYGLEVLHDLDNFLVSVVDDLALQQSQGNSADSRYLFGRDRPQTICQGQCHSEERSHQLCRD